MFDEKDMKYLAEMEQRILEQSAANMRVIVESAIQPQLQVLAEGQAAIRDALVPKSRVEALEDEVAFMKQIIRSMTKDIAELKKAQ